MTSDSIGCWTHINSGMYCGSHNYEHNVYGLSTVESCQNQCILEPKCSQVWFAGPNQPCTLLDCKSYRSSTHQNAVIWEYDSESCGIRNHNIESLEFVPTLVVIQQLQNAPTYFKKKVHFMFQKGTHPLNEDFL